MEAGSIVYLTSFSILYSTSAEYLCLLGDVGFGEFRIIKLIFLIFHAIINLFTFRTLVLFLTQGEFFASCMQRPKRVGVPAPKNEI